MAVKRKYGLCLEKALFISLTIFLLSFKNRSFPSDNATLNSNQTELTARDALRI